MCIRDRYNEALALGYVVFRGALETVMYIVLAIIWLFLIPVSQEYVKAGTPDASYFQTLGAVLLKGHDLIAPVQTIVFCLGALIFYYLLYQTNLIPRWLSGWGLIATIPLSLIHISEPTRQAEISYAVFCLKKKKKQT